MSQGLKPKLLPITATLVATLVGLALLGGGIYALRAKADNPPPAPQNPVVDVAEVVQRTIVDWQSFSGRLEAVDRVEIRPQVSGILTGVHFKDGALVKKGDLLFTIDPRPYVAEVDRAEAQVASAEARAGYTAADQARSERLLVDNAIAKRDVEEKQNAARESAAALLAAKAALALAWINLENTRIRAPFDGVISRAETTPGNLVTANGPTPLTTLVSATRIYAAFDVDEQTFLKQINPARSSKGAPLPVHLGLANEDGYPRRGLIHSVDNRLDVGSGTIRVRALLDNPDGQLLPGLYVRLRLGGGQERAALLIDEKAIGTDQDKRFVLVVDSAGKTAYREIHGGALQDGLRVVEQGLAPGERIVVNGLQRVRPGDNVVAKAVTMDGSQAATGQASTGH